MSISFHLGLLPTTAAANCIEMAKQAEELGYAGIWVADSHSVMRDAYGILAALAPQTCRLLLATGVTHTVTRHPAVLANSWATLHELSNGRAICGVGVGESAVHNLGLRPEKLAVFEHKVRTMQALWRGERVEYEGRELQMPWAGYDIPLVMASSGPRSLQLAGRIADGVMFQVGADPLLAQYALDNIRVGAEQAGRNLDDLKLYARVAVAVADDREKARTAIKGYVSVAAGTVFASVPRKYFADELHEDLAHMKSRYDYAQHASNDSRHSELLTDRIYDAIAIACTPDEAVQRFQALADLGVNGFVWPAGMADPYPFIESFAERVMPRVKSAA
ncbi:MAG: LLM class flavin-dependent oxidoreductase [Xanthomonadales bacterium]|nr:LLM class flavin-dependent oxidoreductase [Xanthomonadales bacterium]